MNGDVYVHPSFEIIVLKLKDSVMVLPAHKVATCLYYNTETKINTKLISLTTRNGGRTVTELFEIVVKGNIDIVRRPKFANRESQNPLDFDYYTHFNSSIHSLISFRQSIFPEMLARQNDKLTTYMVANKLDPNDQADAIRIVQYYNKIHRSEGEVITARK